MEFGTSAKIQDEHLFRLLAEYAAQGSHSRGIWRLLAGKPSLGTRFLPRVKNGRNEAVWTYFSTFLTWDFADSQLLSWHHFGQVREIRARQRLEG